MNWTLSHGDIQPLQLIQNPAAFGVVFTVWIALCLALLVLAKRESERILLLILFSLVFLDFWMIRAPNGVAPDEYVNMGIVKYVVAQGPLSYRVSSLAYLDYPGLDLLGSALSLVIGISITSLRQPLSIVLAGFLVGALYVFFRRLVGIEANPSLMTIFALLGSLVWVHMIGFIPLFFGQVLLTTLLLAMLMKRTALLLVLFAGLVTAYLPNSILFLVLLGMLLVVEAIHKGPCLKTYLVIFVSCAVTFFAWNAYWAYGYFGGTLLYLTAFQLSSLTPALGIVTNVPLWAKAVEYFWLFATLGLGMLVGVSIVFRGKMQDANKRILVAGVLASLIFGATSFVIAPGGQQLDRLLFVSPFFFSPLAWTALAPRIRGRTRLVIFVIVLVLMTFPTFLIQERSISTTIVYSYEVGLGVYLAKHNLVSSSITIDQETVGVIEYYLPTTSLYAPAFSLGDMSYAFGPNSTGEKVVTAISFATLFFTQGPGVTNQFIDVTQVAAESQNVVYDSGSVLVYLPT